MSNHTKFLHHVTFIPWIILKFSPLVGMKALQALATNSKNFRISGTFDIWEIGESQLTL